MTTEEMWTKLYGAALRRFNRELSGKTIKEVRWFCEKETEYRMWHNRPIVIEFEDGSILVPFSDEEGNDGGAMWYADDSNNDFVEMIIHRR